MDSTGQGAGSSLQSSEKTIAFYCGSLGKRALDDWFPVARILRDRGFQSLFLLERPHFSDPDFQRCQTEGFRALDISKPKKPPLSKRRQKWQRLIELTGNRFQLLSRISALLAGMDRLDVHLRREQPLALLTFSDGFSVEFNAVVRTAASLHIPSLVAPLAFFQPPNGYLTSHPRRANYLADYAITKWWHRLLVTLKPSLAPRSFGARCFSIPLADYIASWILGIKPGVPHSRAGGDSVKALAPLELDRQAWIEEGVNPEKIVLTGSAVFDRVSRLALRAESDRPSACAELGLDPARKLIVVNFAALGEYGFLPVEEHKNNLRTILASIREQSDAQIIVSVHPGPFPAYFREIAAEYEATATQELDVASLLVLCDFYVSAPSTTVTFAIGAGKPVVDLFFLDTCRGTPEYDAYMQTFLQIEGTTLCWNLSEMQAAIRKLLGEPDYLARLTHAAKNSPIRRQFDGQCASRIADHLIEVAQASNP